MSCMIDMRLESANKFINKIKKWQEQVQQSDRKIIDNKFVNKNYGVKEFHAVLGQSTCWLGIKELINYF